MNRVIFIMPSTLLWWRSFIYTGQESCQKRCKYKLLPPFFSYVKGCPSINIQNGTAVLEPSFRENNILTTKWSDSQNIDKVIILIFNTFVKNNVFDAGLISVFVMINIFSNWQPPTFRNIHNSVSETPICRLFFAHRTTFVILYYLKI